MIQGLMELEDLNGSLKLFMETYIMETPALSIGFRDGPMVQILNSWETREEIKPLYWIDASVD